MVKFQEKFLPDGFNGFVKSHNLLILGHIFVRKCFVVEIFSVDCLGICDEVIDTDTARSDED